jgi:hypothetical protein
MALVLDKEAGFAECPTEHSTKNLTKGPADGFFAECWTADTRQRVTSLLSLLEDTRQRRCLHHPGTVTETTSLPSTVWHSANSVPSDQEKVLDKEGFADVLFAEPFLPSATLGKRLCRVFLGFAKCLKHSAKRSIPVASGYVEGAAAESGGVRRA